MSRTRLILLGLLARRSPWAWSRRASAAEPPPASGSCTKAGTTPAYCVAGVPLESASENAEGTNVAQRSSKATIAGMTSEIKCENGKSTGTIEGGAAGTVGKSKTKITFETCKLSRQNTASSRRRRKQKLKPRTHGRTGADGREEYWISSNQKQALLCRDRALKAKIVMCHCRSRKTRNFNVTGSQLCEVDSSKTEAETEATNHKLICKATGGLKIGSNPAEMTDETMALN